MASLLPKLYCVPNSSMNPTFVPDLIPKPCLFRQDFPLMKSQKSTDVSSRSRYNLQSDTDNSTVRAKSSAGKLASAWKEIQGSNNWENMVDPLNPLLRREIIRYGEFVSACYKAFDLDPNSKRYLSCKYGKGSMLEEVGLGDSGYDVTKYIYASTPEITTPVQIMDSSSRWIGYVAVSRDEHGSTLGRRDIVIAFRGTVTNPEWMANLMSSLTSARLNPLDPREEVKVEEGFLSLYTSSESSCKFGLRSCRDQLLSEVSRLLRKHEGEDVSITIAGHSMGSSLALLLAYDIAELGLNRAGKGPGKDSPITVFSFGGPRVGNLGFKARCEELGVRVMRVVNVNDPIPRLPGVLFNENFRGFGVSSCSCYAHVGVELIVDFFKMKNPSCVHDLQHYIGLLEGWERNDEEDVKDDRNLMERAMGWWFLLGGGLGLGFGFGFEGLKWGDSAMNMMDLFQSQWT